VTTPDQLVGRVRHRFARDDAPATPSAVVAAVREQPDAAVLGDEALLRLSDRVHADLVGAGALAPLLADVDISDVLVNGVEVWVDRGEGLQRQLVDLGTVEDVRRLAQRLAAAGGRRLDDSSPCVDVQLADGTRLHAVLPPVATAGPYLSLRTFRPRPFTLADLVASGALDEPAAQVLAAVVAARLPYLVSGGTGTGKTTLLATLLSLVPHEERIVLVEDAAELRPRHPHVVGLQTRTPNVEGAGAIGLRELIRQALRMRPDRIVVGECRGAEVADLLAALNTGHEGGAGTLHANTAEDVPARLEALGLLGGLPREVLHAQVAAALQVVLHLRRTAGRRVLDAVCLLLPGDDRLVSAVPAWQRDHGSGPAAPVLGRLLAARAVPVPELLTGAPPADRSPVWSRSSTVDLLPHDPGTGVGQGVHQPRSPVGDQR
jgi:pilus assembly protein CpaF